MYAPSVVQNVPDVHNAGSEPLRVDEARLVTARDLASRLGEEGWVVIDARYRLADRAWGPRAYAEGHLPGAFYAHLEEDLSDPPRPDEGRHPLPGPARLAAFLAACGAHPGGTLVVYDEASLPGAFRLWWLALRLGFTDVRVLDGGLRAWTAAGFGLERGATRPGRARPFEPRLREGLAVDTPEIERWALGEGGGLVIDARERRRYLGLAEPIDPVAGHIPRARNLPYTATVGRDGRLLPPERLRALLARVLGPSPPGRVAHACGSGVTACQTLFAMARAGYEGGLLYSGSYSAWISRPGRPVACGPEDGLGGEDVFEREHV